MTIKGEHTPGPWYVRDFRESYMRELGWAGPSIDRILITNKSGAEIVESGGENCVIARIQFDNRPESLGEGNLADARLIAAAPDMLEALRLFIAEHDNTYDGEPLSVEMGRFITKARYAIAKAEGRSDAVRKEN